MVEILEEKAQFIKNFADQYDDIKGSDLSFQTHFRDIEGWSSITALMIIAMVDEFYKVSLSAEDMIKSMTIEDIYNIMISKK